MLDLRVLVATSCAFFVSFDATVALAGQPPSLFWSDTTIGTIERVAPDGSDRQTLLSDLDYPEGLVVDVDADRIYWVDAGSSSLYSARLDGTDAVPLLSGLSSPAGLAFDREAELFFWTNVAFGALWRANADGTGVVELASLGGHSRGVAIDPIDAKVYVSGGENTRLERMDYDGGNRELVMDGLPAPVDVALDLEAGKVYVATSEGVYRSNLSGSGFELVTPASASGLAVDPNAGRIYASDLSGIIWSANLDGSDFQVLLSSGSGRPRHLISYSPDPAGAPETPDAPETHDVGPVLSNLDVSASPNPFGAWTRLEFRAARGPVAVNIYDASGRSVRTLESVDRAGTVLWDGLDERGEPLPSGAYLFRARSGDAESTGTLMRIR
ncbi:MAG: hypothetical protein H6682_16325 [Candidatus Eisenbacteria bacterium]|nr:hypothetical protein [Candidatus Eisenbacteria bacterium]